MGMQIQLIRDDERGVTFMATMIIMLMIAILGVTALTMSGIGNSTIGALRMAKKERLRQNRASELPSM